MISAITTKAELSDVVDQIEHDVDYLVLREINEAATATRLVSRFRR